MEATVKRRRRSAAEMERLRDEIYRVAEEIQPATVRQIYYQCVVRGIVPKTQAQYSGTVCRLLGEMREEGRLPFEWIADHTRWVRKPKSHRSLSNALARMQANYRRDLWSQQAVHLEVWCESDAISGVLYPITAEWDVPLMVTRGYSSKSFLYESAQILRRNGKANVLVYFGDHDPSGRDIDRDIEAKLRTYAPEADFTFERLAVLEEQVEEWALPGAPPKKSDSRIKRFKGNAVELEAIHPDRLREIVERAITVHLDEHVYQQTLLIEDAERETLEQVILGLDEGAA